MPILTTKSSHGRILFLEITDPLTTNEVQQSSIDGADYFESVSFEVHVLIDIRSLKVVNPNILNPSTFRNVTHNNHGLMAVVGAKPIVRSIANSVMYLLGYTRVRFFASDTEARAWVEAQVAVDTAGEDAVT